MTAKASRLPYGERSDHQKIKANWNKVRGLLKRKEWSAAIVRAATAAEIAANLVIRDELIAKRQLDAALVDHFLKWANGIQGKFDKLIIPLVKGREHSKAFGQLAKRVQDINQKRNAVVHTGSFGSEKDARAVTMEAYVVIQELIRPYGDRPGLKKPD